MSKKIKLLSPEEKEQLNALKAITALRQLEALKLLTKKEIESISSKISKKYGEFLSPLRRGEKVNLSSSTDKNWDSN